MQRQGAGKNAKPHFRAIALTGPSVGFGRIGTAVDDNKERLFATTGTGPPSAVLINLFA